MAKDAKGHFHDARGRFGRTGAVRVDLEGPRLRKTQAQPEAEARKKWFKTRARAASVDEAFIQHVRGERVAEPGLIYLRGRSARPEQRHEPVLDRFAALQQATRGLRGVKGAAFRHETKRAFSGKAMAVRGWKAREFTVGSKTVMRGFGTRTRVLNGAGKKPGRRSARDMFAPVAAYLPRHGTPD